MATMTMITPRIPQMNPQENQSKFGGFTNFDSANNTSLQQNQTQRQPILPRYESRPGLSYINEPNNYIPEKKVFEPKTPFVANLIKQVETLDPDVRESFMENAMQNIMQRLQVYNYRVGRGRQLSADQNAEYQSLIESLNELQSYSMREPTDYTIPSSNQQQDTRQASPYYRKSDIPSGMYQ